MLTPTLLARVLRAAAKELDTIAAEQASEATRAVGADDLLGLGECGVSVRTLRAAVKSGALRASKVGREYRVRRGDLSDWIEARTVQPRAAQPIETTEADRAFDRAMQSGSLRLVATR